jgi:hypothetical protein
VDFDLTQIAVKRSTPMEVGEPMPLTQADLELLKVKPAEGKHQLKRLKERHHQVARLLAMGTRPGAVAIITGYSAHTIGLLQSDPSFQDLLAFYRNDEDDEYRKMRAQLVGLGDDALAEIRDRLENSPEKFTIKELREVVTMVADRTGNGPSSSVKTELNVTVGLADRLRAARERAAANTIDLTALPVIDQ